MSSRGVGGRIRVGAGLCMLCSLELFACLGPSDSISTQLGNSMGRVLASSGQTSAALTQAQLALMALDQILIDDDGNKSVLTAVDGETHPLLPKPSPVPTTTNENPNPAETPCPSRVITQATGPDKVMLDELGYITPVVDQYGRGTCDNFSAAEALESAYLIEYYKMTSDQFTAKYGHPLLLSEQYMITIKDFSKAAFNDTGSGVANLQKLAPYCGGAPMYGLPLASDWPYVDTDRAVEELMMKSVPKAPADTLDFTTMMGATGPTGSNGVPMALNIDLANYQWSNLTPALGAPTGPGAAVFPPQAVHDQAFWAPLKVVPVSLPNGADLADCDKTELTSYPPVTSSAAPSGGASLKCYEALAAPVEQVLSEHHAISVAVNFDLFKMSTSLGAYYYDNPTSENPHDDVILLVGYDRTSQQFKIKNSWGTQWGINGFAYVTYDLMLRTMGGAAYVDEVYDSSQGPVPNLMWRGLWRGQLGGKSGVAAVHHLLWDSTSATETPAGIFYGEDGTQTPINFLSWEIKTDGSSASYTGHFGDANFKALFSLTLQKGSLDPIATYVDAVGKSGASWYKCNPDGLAVESVLPESYLQAESDPYLLPPCLDTQPAQPWHVSPTWSCPQGAIYVDSISYEPPGGTTHSYRNGCLAVSGTPPKCPSGDRIEQDKAQTKGFDPGNTAPGAPLWLDVCSGAASLSCNPNETDTSNGGCPRPTCPAPTSVFGIGGAQLTIGSTEAGVWAKQGADVCVTEAGVATAKCPDGYALSGNGNDCVLKAK
jgi:hypothetical protein